MKKIIHLLVIILVFFATLDGLRDTFLADNPISYLKEATAIALFFLLVITAIRRKMKINRITIVIFNIAMVFLLLISFITTRYADASLSRVSLGFGGWSVWIKFLSLYCIMNSLYILKVLYPDIYYKLPKLYVYFTILYCLITLFFILTGLSASLASRNWSGRLSIGYPTMDSFVLVAAIIFSAFFQKNKTIKLISIILFMIVLVMQNTATGYIMLAGVGMLSVLSLRGLSKSIPIISVVPALYLGYLVYDSLWVYMGTFGALFVDKVNGFIFGADTSSIELRQTQISVLMKDMDTFLIYKFFGKGGSEAYLVESTYYAFYGLCGIIGIALLISSLLFFVSKIPSSFKRKTFYCHSFFITAVFIVSSSGLIGFYLFPFIFIYAYLASIYFFPESEHEKYMELYS